MNDQHDQNTVALAKQLGQISATRRQLLSSTVTATGAWSLGLSLTACGVFQRQAVDGAGNWKADAWLEIQPDNTILFTLDRVEMGQGTYTGLTTLLAEELGAEPEQIEVKFAPAAKEYRNPDYGMQLTGGSNSLSTSWWPLRHTGAAAREMLLAAAAEVFQVPSVYLRAESGHIVHPASGKKLSFGSLIRLAAKQDVPDEPSLTSADKFKYIGKPGKRLDSLQKVKGSAVYGIDSNVAGSRYAVVTRSPYIGASLKSSNADEIAQLDTVEQVVEIKTGVAIVATSYWAARQAQQKLETEWAREAEAPKNTQQVFELYKRRADEDEGDSIRSDGDLEKTIKNSNKVLEREYEAPFLAHATMEPMNCTAHVQKDRADIWTSTQAPDLAQVVVAKVTDLSLDEVFIHNQFIGGGFGRRLTQDFIGEAAEISYKTGLPIKLVWSREEDTQNDLYRPASYHRIRASFDSAGQLSGWDHQIVCPKIMDWYVWDAAPAMFPWAPKFMYKMLGHAGLMTEGTPMTPADRSPYEGAENLPYDIPAVEVRHTKADAGVPVTFWRSVGHSHNAFVTEGFIDELAHEAGQDTYAFRAGLLSNSPRLKRVLDLAAEKGAWGRTTEEGVFQGIAAHISFGTYVAQLVELKIEHGEIKVSKVVCAVDCGTVVNPDIVRMQMESGVIFGITAALYGEITIENGQIQQSNFHDYQLLRMNQCPVIETHIVDSDASPTGVGEPGLPPVAPAMASAVFAATGKRLRRLPLRLA